MADELPVEIPVTTATPQVGATKRQRALPEIPVATPPAAAPAPASGSGGGLPVIPVAAKPGVTRSKTT
jgi:hypothetical protein